MMMAGQAVRRAKQPKGLTLGLQGSRIADQNLRRDSAKAFRIDLPGLEQVQALDRDDVISLSLDVDPTKRDHQRANPSYRIWLRRALVQILAQAPRERRAEIRELINRVLARVDDHRHGRGLAIVAAPGVWREFVLPFPLPNRVHYGRPDLMPVLWALDEYEPYAILAVTHAQVRLILAFLGQAAVIDQEVLVLDTSTWRAKSGRPPTFSKRTGTGAGRGAQRDTFDARVDEQQRRFWRSASEATTMTLRDLGVGRLILVGPAEATAAVAHLFEEGGAVRVVATVPAPPHASPIELRDLVLRAALAEERRRERELVTALLERAGNRTGGVVGPTATLDALNHGRVQLVVVDARNGTDIWQCQQCGVASATARATCPNCGSPMVKTSLLYALPLLVRRYGAELEIVSGEASDLLAPHGHIGATLRYDPTSVAG